MNGDDNALARVEAARLQAEERLAELRRSMKSEVGWAPSSSGWVLLTVALSSGLALAYWLRSRR